MVDLSESVQAFVARQVGVPVETVSRDTTLFGDLGVDGDDADELLSAFSRRFGVDLSGFERRKYFGGEGLSPFFLFSWLSALWRRGTPEARSHLQPLPIDRLVESARVGRWQGDA